MVLSLLTDTKWFPFGEKRMQLTYLVWSLLECWNLNGGPAKKLTCESSPPVAIRKGRSGLIPHVNNCLECPEISPTEDPVSYAKTYPNTPLPSPTTTTL